MASSLSKRHGHLQEGILSVLHHHSDDDDDDDDENSITTMKLVGALQRRGRRSVSADMSNDQTRRSDDHVNSWFAPTTKTVETAPPYVHPLVKKSASAVSLKSLEACTESLGSESGSDGFSTLPIEEEDQDRKKQQQVGTGKINKLRHTRSSFPPPIPSLSYRHQDGGQGQPLHVRSHRNLGRLVLEATAHPVQAKNFQAQREDGRLLLAFTTDGKEEEEEEEIGSNHHTKKEDEVEEGEDETRVLKSCKLDPPSNNSLLSWGKPPPQLLLTS